MRSSRRRSIAALALIVGLFATACGVPASPPAPSAQGSPSPSAARSATPSAVPSASGPTGGCPLPTTTGVLPSNTLTGITVEGGTTSDRMTFQFGDRADIPPEAVGRLSAATPPFTMAGSGDQLTVVGDHFLEVVFTGMYLSDEAGNPTLQGQRDARWGFPAIKHSVVFDESEGQFGLIVGYQGDGCVALGGDPEARTVTIDITHIPG